MAKRGRPPKDAASRKSAQLGLRISPTLRAQLEEARLSADPERTLSSEIEFRLRTSFQTPQTEIERFGGPENYWLCRTIAERAAGMQQQTGKAWWTDRYSFDEFFTMVTEFLDYFRPRGGRVVPARLKGYDLGKQTAFIAVANLQMAVAGWELGPSVFGAAGALIWPKRKRDALPLVAAPPPQHFVPRTRRSKKEGGK